MAKRRFVLLLILLMSFCIAFVGFKVEAGEPDMSDSSPTPFPLELRLKDGAKSGEEAPKLPQAAFSSDLSQLRIVELLKMFTKPLPDIKEPLAFFKRPSSKAAPVSVTSVKLPFPPPAAGVEKPVAPFADLEVLAIAPQGETERAPRLSITFNQPMIAVGDPEAAEKGDPLDISIEPRASGSWRWIGTSTLIFEPTQGEFPRATEYKVRVPAGIKGVSGQELKLAKEASFKLPAPSVSFCSPTGSPVGLNPLITISFDQPIDRQSLLSKLTLASDKGKVELQELSKAQAKALAERRREAFKDGAEDSVFWFQPKQDLKPGTSYSIGVEAGLKGQQGPLGLIIPYTSMFGTYQPFRLEQAYPEESDQASPFSPFSLTFNNDIDRASFKSEFISFTPPLADARFRISGRTLEVLGAKSGKTKYKAVISSELSDIYGQKLSDKVMATLVTASAPKVLFSTYETMTVLSPSTGGLKLPIYTTNVEKLRLIVHKVEPADWLSFLKYSMDSARYSVADAGPKLPGKELADTLIDIKNTPDKLVASEIELDKYFSKERGNIVILLSDPSEDREAHRQRKVLTWIQATELGLDLDTTSEQAVVRVSNLRDGKPIAGAVVSLGDASSSTQGDGTTILELSHLPSPMLVAKSTDEQAFLPYSSYYNLAGSGWSKTAKDEEVRSFIFDDRGLYKPGETVHVKGYLRKWTRGPQAALFEAGVAGQKISWTLKDARANKLSEGSTELSALASFDLSLELPKDTNLGYHQLSLSAPGLISTTHRINVQEFRRPEFEVTSWQEGSHLCMVGGSATVGARASYYAGGALRNSAVSWLVTAKPTSYAPPGHSEYTFGQWSPWWDLGPWWISPRQANSKTYSFKGMTNYEGEHRIELDFGKAEPPEPTLVTATASVSDVNRQQLSSSSKLLVHPSSYYVGLRSDKTFVDEKSDFKLQAIVSDIDGGLLPEVPMKLSLYKLDYEVTDDGYTLVKKEVGKVSLASAQEAVEASLPASEGGSYEVQAEVVDASGRRNLTTIRLWKAGGILPSKNKVELESLSLVPQAKEYRPGEKASILVMAPFSEGEGTVLWSRDGILKKEHFSLKNGSATIGYPITEDLVPNLYARVTVTGTTSWGKTKRPAIASASLDISVSNLSRKLKVELSPAAAKLDPGAEVELEVAVNDEQNSPVEGAEVTLWMVDEAVLGLVDYKLPDLLQAFYTHRPAGIDSRHLRTSVALPAIDFDELEQQALKEGRSIYKSDSRIRYSMAVPPPAPAPGDMPFAEMARAGGGGEPAPSFVVRKDFNALAVFKAKLATDEMGSTRVKIKLPDNLTRYRILSVAVKGATEFGSGDEVLTARLPLMVKPSLPRFLNFGDRAKLPVVVQNQSDKPLEVELIGEASGVEWVGSNGRKVRVPANDRVEVSFECEAKQVGRAKFRFGAVSGPYSDAAELELPVYTPATSEDFATYGNIGDLKGAIGQMVSRPSDVWPQFGGLKLSFSSTALSELTDAFLYLYAYPFECSEQRASRILSIAALDDVLAAFNAPGMPKENEIKARMQADISSLYRMQSSDGGWSFWGDSSRSLPFVSLHVSQALARAQMAGFKVDEGVKKRALNYLRLMESNCKGLKYSEKAMFSCMAYALYVRDLWGEPDLVKAKELFARLTGDPKSLNLEALGWLWPTLSKQAKGSAELLELKRLVLNRATQTADKAQFSMGYEEAEGSQLLLHSSRRTDAILLYGLLVDDPHNALNPKLVRGLLAQRKKGRWESTQENSWILLALQKYFRTFESEAPNFVAQAWMADSYLGEESFKGYSNKEAQLELAMSSLPEKATDLVIGKEGAGRLYYRLAMSYAPKELRLDPKSRGFSLERKFEGLDNSADVSQNSQGDWIIRAGAKVKVTLSMVVPERRYHVALVDPLAAGMEALNPQLIGTPPVADGSDAPHGIMRYLWWWRWYEHENLRDERVEAFASILYPGVYTYTYTALASTPGEYVLPPTKAEEMYSPEVYGRTGSGRLSIK